MTRLIDADAFKKENERLLHCDFPYLSETTLEELIDEAPTIDAIPIEWILNHERMPKEGKGHDAIMDMITDWREKNGTETN